MAERRENSVLFSLKELRDIENERVKQEEDTEKARLDAERKAREEGERRAAAEAEAKRREEEDRLRKMQDDKERQLREEQMRLEAEKHRAQVEAASRLEAARIQAEVHAAAVAKKAPVGMIVGIVGAILALAGGVLAYVFLVVIPQRDAAAQAERDKEVARLMAKINDQESQMQAEKRKLEDELAKTTDAAKKAELQARMAANQAALDKAEKDKQAIKATRSVKPKAKTNKPGGAACDPNDPLCGSGELK